MEDKLTRRSLLSALAILPATRLLSGQQEQPAAEQKPKYEANVKVVNVFATVRDKSGKIVKDLNKADFTLTEEDHPQTIKFFESESSLPLHLGLMVDTSFSQARVIGDERSAGMRFFDQILREDKDQAFVLHFDHEIELLQDFTPSHQALNKAINLLEVAPPQQQNQGGTNPQGGNYPQQGGGYPGGGGYPPGRRYPGGGGGGGYPSGGNGRGGRAGTKLYDAILLGSEDLMSKQQGRKALILLTDGVDHGSKVTLFEGIRAAQKSDTLVYSVLFADDSAYSGPSYGGMGRRRMPMPGGGQDGPDGKKILKQIAAETGGSFYQVSHFHPLDKIFADIEEDLRNQYNIGYTPDTSSDAGIFKHIHLTAQTKKKKDLVVQARAGYYTT